jgi:hypothetical protein
LGKRRLKDKVTLQTILVFTLTQPKTFRLVLCKCNKIYIHCNRISVNVTNLDM